ncbi:MAG TPA: GNAT family N-acetyltransferase [Phnomibacter sp.]|nr:GNAT family N-acetyltransferase [Phnomibacter sp.]
MNHIQYIQHVAIDKQKWDACIERAVNSLIYAQSIYLDHMSEEWDALVYGNYEAVMPVTWRKKWGMRYMCQPAFSQQLGLFYIDPLHKNLLPNFLQQLSANFRLVEIFLNYDNTGSSEMQPAMNFVLPLHADYESIKAGYKTDLHKNLKRTEKFNLQYHQLEDASAAVKMYREYYQQRMGAKPNDYDNFLACIQKLMAEKKAIVRSVTQSNGALLATGIFAIDHQRIYNLASTTLPNGRMMEANHFLMDALIREFAESGLTLDFEGSDQPGIAKFYQKFGSIPQPYYFWKINRLPAILRWCKR